MRTVVKVGGALALMVGIIIFCAREGKVPTKEGVAITEEGVVIVEKCEVETLGVNVPDSLKNPVKISSYEVESAFAQTSEYKWKQLAKIFLGVEIPEFDDIKRDIETIGYIVTGEYKELELSPPILLQFKSHQHHLLPKAKTNSLKKKLLKLFPKATDECPRQIRQASDELVFDYSLCEYERGKIILKGNPQIIDRIEQVLEEKFPDPLADFKGTLKLSFEGYQVSIGEECRWENGYYCEPAGWQSVQGSASASLNIKRMEFQTREEELVGVTLSGNVSISSDGIETIGGTETEKEKVSGSVEASIDGRFEKTNSSWSVELYSPLILRMSNIEVIVGELSANGSIGVMFGGEASGMDEHTATKDYSDFLGSTFLKACGFINISRGVDSISSNFVVSSKAEGTGSDSWDEEKTLSKEKINIAVTEANANFGMSVKRGGETRDYKFRFSGIGTGNYDHSDEYEHYFKYTESLRLIPSKIALSVSFNGKELVFMLPSAMFTASDKYDEETYIDSEKINLSFEKGYLKNFGANDFFLLTEPPLSVEYSGSYWEKTYSTYGAIVLNSENKVELKPEVVDEEIKFAVYVDGNRVGYIE